jgi:hypothetical protein
MELNPSWEVANCTTTLEFPRTLRKPKVMSYNDDDDDDDDDNFQFFIIYVLSQQL